MPASSSPAALLGYAASLVLAPFMVGVVNRVKARFGGRCGKPLMQPYFDIIKLLRKGAVYSTATSWVFRAGPVVSLAAVLTALLFMPLGGPAVLSFTGDIFLFAYLLGLGRFFTMAAALDTGSSFEGMGASREAVFSALAEPVLFLSLLALARQAHDLSLNRILGDISTLSWFAAGPALALITVALFILMLAENCRIPFDDPNTHLELTMIHEVMVLDHSGPDLGFIQYAAALKLWLLAAAIVNMLLPQTMGSWPVDIGFFVITMLVMGVAVGVVESVMARARLTHVPQLLTAAGAMAGLALVLFRS